MALPPWQRPALLVAAAEVIADPVCIDFPLQEVRQ